MLRVNVAAFEKETGPCGFAPDGRGASGYLTWRGSGPALVLLLDIFDPGHFPPHVPVVSESGAEPATHGACAELLVE